LVGHRRFLKKKDFDFIPGNYFPKQMRLRAKCEPIDISNLSKSENGTLVFILSDYCSACNIQVVTTMTQSHPEFNYCIFYEAGESQIAVSNSVEVLKVEIREIENYLNYGAVMPWVFALNQVGQIVGGGVFNTYKDIIQISKGLINVYEDKIKMKGGDVS